MTSDVSGFAGAVMKKVPFSIFILGVLVVAVVVR